MNTLTHQTLSILWRGPSVRLSSAILAVFNHEPTENRLENAKIIRKDIQMNKVYEVAIEAIRQKHLHDILDLTFMLQLTPGKPDTFYDYKVQFSHFFQWAKPIFGDLILLNFPKQEKKPEDDAKIDSRVEKTLLRIIFALVHKHYPKYDPNTRNDETAKILRLIELLKLDVGRDTLKAKLDQAFELYEEEKEQISKS